MTYHKPNFLVIFYFFDLFLKHVKTLISHRLELMRKLYNIDFPSPSAIQFNNYTTHIIFANQASFDDLDTLADSQQGAETLSICSILNSDSCSSGLTDTSTPDNDGANKAASASFMEALIKSQFTSESSAYSSASSSMATPPSKKLVKKPSPLTNITPPPRKSRESEFANFKRLQQHHQKSARETSLLNHNNLKQRAQMSASSSPFSSSQFERYCLDVAMKHETKTTHTCFRTFDGTWYCMFVSRCLM